MIKILSLNFLPLQDNTGRKNGEEANRLHLQQQMGDENFSHSDGKVHQYY